jgi:L-asparagine transporter-like permease
MSPKNRASLLSATTGESMKLAEQYLTRTGFNRYRNLVDELDKQRILGKAILIEALITLLAFAILYTLGAKLFAVILTLAILGAVLPSTFLGCLMSEDRKRIEGLSDIIANDEAE